MSCIYVGWLLAGSGWSSKLVEVNYRNKLKINSASCWFLLQGYITMHGPQNIKSVMPNSLTLIRRYFGGIYCFDLQSQHKNGSGKYVLE
jgi:hypothetical protein